MFPYEALQVFLSGLNRHMTLRMLTEVDVSRALADPSVSFENNYLPLRRSYLPGVISVC